METDLPILEKYQIPISNPPKDTCSKCFGRGYTSIDKYENYVPCKWILKNIIRKPEEKKTSDVEYLKILQYFY